MITNNIFNTNEPNGIEVIEDNYEEMCRLLICMVEAQDITKRAHYASKLSDGISNICMLASKTEMKLESIKTLISEMDKH